MTDAEPADGLTLPPPPAKREGGVVRRSGRLLLRHARPLVAVLGPVAFVAAVPAALAQTAMMRDLGVDWAQSQTMDPTLMGGRWMVVQAVSAGLDILILLPVLFAVAYLLLRGGRGQGMRPVLREAVRVWPRAAGAFALSLLATLVPFLPGAALVAIGAVTAGPELFDMSEGATGDIDPRAGLLLTFGAVSIMAGGVVSAFVALSLALVVPLAVLDGVRPVAALRASWDRMGRHRLRLVGGQLALGLPVMVVLLALGVASGVSTGRFVPALLSGTANSFATVAIMAAVTSIIHADTSTVEPESLTDSVRPADLEGDDPAVG